MELSGTRRDSAAVGKGVWIGDLPQMDDLEVCVRGLGHPLVVNAIARRERKVSAKDRESDGTIKPEVRRVIYGEVLAEYVLLDWKNLTEDGEQIPYSQELALKLLQDPDYEPFADAVTQAATRVDRMRADAKESARGNSKRSSRGSSATAEQPAS